MAIAAAAAVASRTQSLLLTAPPGSCAWLTQKTRPGTTTRGGAVAGTPAIGTGWMGYQRPGDPGPRRLLGAAAITAGAIGLVLGALRVALALAAIERIDRMLG